MELDGAMEQEGCRKQHLATYHGDPNQDGKPENDVA
jgi:hypothetical protein